MRFSKYTAAATPSHAPLFGLSTASAPGRGFTDTLGAAAGREAQIARHDGDEEAEDDRLQRRRDEIREAEIEERALEVQTRRHARHGGFGDVAAEDAGTSEG